MALIVLGFALGVAFLKTEFSFTASWRRMITRGQTDFSPAASKACARWRYWVAIAPSRSMRWSCA